MKTTAQARAAVDLLQHSVEVELFATRDRAERAKLLEEHAGIRQIAAGVAEREAAEAEARHALWLREVGEEIRLARLLGTRLEIYRKGLSPRQKAELVRRLGREGYRRLPFSMSDRRGAW